MAEASPVPSIDDAELGPPKSVEESFERAHCHVPEGGEADPRYAYLNVPKPDREAFFKTLDLSAFERVGMPPKDIDTLKAYAFACAFLLSVPMRTDKYGKPDQPDDHDGRSAWVEEGKALFGAAFHEPYKANRFRINIMLPVLSKTKKIAELASRYEVMPKKAELIAALGKLPKEYLDAPEDFNARYAGSKAPGAVPLEEGSEIAALLKQLEKAPALGLKQKEPVVPMTFAEKRRFVEELSSAARAYLAVVEKK